MEENIKITGETKFSEILKVCPQLIDEMVKINPQAKMLKNPIFKMMLGKITVRDMCSQAKIDENLLINNFNKIIQKFKK